MKCISLLIKPKPCFKYLPDGRAHSNICTCIYIYIYIYIYKPPCQMEALKKFFKNLIATFCFYHIQQNEQFSIRHIWIALYQTSERTDASEPSATKFIFIYKFIGSLFISFINSHENLNFPFNFQLHSCFPSSILILFPKGNYSRHNDIWYCRLASKLIFCIVLIFWPEKVFISS